MEAASAIGLTRGQSLRLVQLPQSFRIMLPALISQLVVVLKDTSLGFVILFPEAISFARKGSRTVGARCTPCWLHCSATVIAVKRVRVRPPG